MGIEDLGLLLENIEEYVMEQKKVVTYKWLSRTFSLNVNQAKQLLAIFHMKHKNMRHKSIQGTYYVSGMRTNSQGVLTHQICIVTEDMLEATKAQLDPITGVHLYCVQKGKPKETTPMYNVDLEQLKKKVYQTTEFSMIRCKEAKISQVINNSLRPVTPPALKNKVKVMAPKTESKPMEVRKPSVTKKSAPVKKVSDSKKKQGDLANFFGKGKAELKKPEPKKSEPKRAEPKKAEPKKIEPKKTEPKKTEPKKTEPKKTEPKKTEPKKTFENETMPETTKKSKKTDVSPRQRESKKKSPQHKSPRPPLFVDLEEDETVEEDTTVKEEKTVESISKTNGKSCMGTKRKRVMQFSDDEEDNSAVATKGQVTMTTLVDDEGICLDEGRDQQKAVSEPMKESPESKKAKVGRKRVKKLVSKTSVNEEGFMETEKVWEVVSCTDEEDEVVEEKEEQMDVPSMQARNKQSNLMGFFKKG